MVLTRRITALWASKKITAFQKLDLLLSSVAEVGRGLFLLTGPRGRGITTEMDAVEKINISCLCRELNVRPQLLHSTD